MLHALHLGLLVKSFYSYLISAVAHEVKWNVKMSEDFDEHNDADLWEALEREPIWRKSSGGILSVWLVCYRLFNLASYKW